MKKRFKMKRKSSNKLFRRTADLSHKYNSLGGVRILRGGYRL